MRIGELLVATGRITAAQLEQALRSQVVWGGRLGSVLVELGYIDLDELTRGLASMHQMPAALSSHFDQVTRELQARLPAEIAALWSCVPITRLPGGTRIAIAVASPLPLSAKGEIATYLSTQPDALLVGVAAEMRIRYHLELAYGIARDQRFLRKRSGRASEPPPSDAALSLDDVADDISDVNIAVPVPELSKGEAPPPPSAEIYPAEPAADEQDPTKKRRYMSTLADAEPEPKAALGRIAIRKAAVANPLAEIAAGLAKAESQEVASIEDAARLIRRATDRDKVGKLALQTCQQFAPQLHTVALFVVRGEVAIGWQGRRGETDLGPILVNVVVPLDMENLVAQAAQQGLVCRPLEEVRNQLDWRLLEELDQPPRGAGLVVAAPIRLGDRVACVMVGVGPEPLASAKACVDVVASAASTAFVRLLKAAGR